MRVLFRALTLATLFISLFFVFLPSRLLSWSGVTRPAVIGAWQVVGMVLTAGGLAIGLWSVFAFALVGRGTPAPFDPPRHLVVRGPYRFVRNPMYVGAVVALAGAALFYGSVALAVYAAVFLCASYAVVRLHEEPALRASFGAEYDDYSRRVGRWRPRFK